jgi:LuxR family transcriptional regulator, quorum-sensing system regulator BjaR1
MTGASEAIAVDGLAGSILSGTTLEAVGDRFHKAVVAHGYTASACRAFAPSAGGAEPRMLFRNWPGNWARLSDERGFASASIMTTEARARLTPFTWLEARDSRPLTLPEQEVWESALAFGWRNGFVLPIHGPGGYFATISMGSLEHDLDLRPENRARLQMLATLTHERVCILAGMMSREQPLNRMTPREIECLRWVATGKTDPEIGEILSISATTVKFHVDRARTKLGSRTRAQAVARLVLYGLY